MSNKLYIFTSTIILSFIRIFFQFRIALCSDHNAYTGQLYYLKLFQDKPIFTLDSINSLLLFIFPNFEIKEISIFYTFFSTLVYLVAVFLLIRILDKLQIFLLILSPLLFSIVFWHYWTCAYRQGLSTSFIALFLATLLTIKERKLLFNSIILSIAALGALISHWTALFYLPFLLLTNPTIIGNLNKIFKQIIKLKLNKRIIFLFFTLIFLTIIIFYFVSENSLDIIFRKSSNYGDLSNILSSGVYGTKYPLSVLLSISPYVITRLILVFSNRKANKDNLFTDLTTFLIAIIFSVYSVGSFMRFLVPLQLIFIINLIINLRFFSKYLYYSSLVTLSISGVFGIYYTYFRLLDLVLY